MWLAMFYDKKIDVLGNTGYLDDNGLWVEGKNTVIKTIECDVQPYNKELAYRDYSFEEDVKYRVFCDPESLIKLGIQVSYQEVFKEEKTIFNVVYIIPWDDYWILLLDN